VLSGLASASFARRRTTLLHACVQVGCPSLEPPVPGHASERRLFVCVTVAGDALAQVLPACTPCEFSHLADDLLPALVTTASRRARGSPPRSPASASYSAADPLPSKQRQPANHAGLDWSRLACLDLVGRALVVLLDGVGAAGADDRAVEALARHLAVLCTRVLKGARAAALEEGEILSLPGFPPSGELGYRGAEG
jgi:hypothetical protein